MAKGHRLSRHGVSTHVGPSYTAGAHRFGRKTWMMSLHSAVTGLLGSDTLCSVVYKETKVSFFVKLIPERDCKEDSGKKGAWGSLRRHDFGQDGEASCSDCHADMPGLSDSDRI